MVDYQSRETNLRKSFEEILSKYPKPSEWDHSDYDSSHEGYQAVMNAEKEVSVALDSPDIYVDASAGLGRWTVIPWIALIDKREENNTKNGVYAVYLFDPEEEKFYLTIGLGVKDLEDEEGRSSAREILKEKAESLAEEIETPQGFSEGRLEFSNSNVSSFQGELYGPATAIYKEYSADNLPSEKELRDDLNKTIKTYRKYTSSEMENSNPNIFLAPCSNDDAYAHLRDTVIQRVPVETVNEFSDHKFNYDAVSIWGNRGGTEVHWQKVEEGDFLLFYRDKEYIYAAEVLETERNLDLSEKLWPDHGGDPWKLIIYLREPFRIELPHSEIRSHAGFADNYYLQGFLELNDDGIRSIKQKYGSVREFLKTKKTGPAIPQTSFLDYTSGGSGSKATLSDASADYSAEDISIASEPAVNIPDNLLKEKNLFFSDDEEILSQVEAALNSGNHIIFTGPPGTGKTEIAEAVSEYLADNYGSYTGAQTTTATADWSTFDTVGGYMPDSEDGDKLNFTPGQVLKRFRSEGKQKNDLLVIDEINRADIDKAFGQLFTVLSGQSVQLPYTDSEDREIEIVSGETVEEEDISVSDNQYVIPESWRLMATMNSYDKTSLYEMSYAFMRRFTFIQVGVPDLANRDPEFLENYMEYWSVEVTEYERHKIFDVWKATNDAGRNIGPAIVRDMLKFVENSSSDNAVSQSVVNYVLPQLEGVIGKDEVVSKLLELDIDTDLVEKTASDMLQVDLEVE